MTGLDIFALVILIVLGVAQIWHWLALTGIKTQRAHKTNNLPTLLSGNIWHWQASASSYYHFSMV